VVQVGSQLTELSPCTLFLSDLFLSCLVLEVAFQKLTDLLILVLNMLQVLLACVKVVLVLATVVSSIASQSHNIVFD